MNNIPEKYLPMTEYISVSECIRRNGYRHYCNGMSYLECGMTAHARGSFAKAQRNYDRIRVLWWYDEVSIISQDIWDSLVNSVAKVIING